MKKTTQAQIRKELELYQKQVANVLTKEAVKAHIAGDIKAHKVLETPVIAFDLVQKEAIAYGKKYGTLLKKEGATIIKGKKVKWLAESSERTRKQVSDIINEGLRIGKPVAHIGGKKLIKGTIAYDLKQTLIRDKNYEYVRIARTETGNIQAHAADKRYKEEGVEEVEWLCGPKPCPICAQYCGKIYKIDEAPELLVHPNCTCDKAPVVTRKVRATIDKKTAGIKKPLTKKEELKQLKKEERATADELWSKTSKDGREHAKITNAKTFYAGGKEKSVEWVIPKSAFKAQHTHPKWDSPLSGGDLANFLVIPHYKQCVASSPKRIYVAKKKLETVTPWKSHYELDEDFKSIANEINSEATRMFNNKMGRPPTKVEALKIWHDANNETNKLFAKEYKYDYISFTR